MPCDLCLVPAVFGGIISNNCNNINYYSSSQNGLWPHGLYWLRGEAMRLRQTIMILF